MRYSHIALALEVLRLLAEKPYKRDDLIAALDSFFRQGDRHQKLSRLMRELRDDCGFAIESAPSRPYKLIESNFPVILSLPQRQTLYMAAKLLDSVGFSTQGEQLLRLGRLKASDAPPDLKPDFCPPADYGEERLRTIADQLQDRCAQQECYAIRYCGSSGKISQVDLDRSEFRLHDGMLYLFAFVPDYKRSHPVEQNSIFRIDRIEKVGEPSGIRWKRSFFPSLKIRYRMSGPLATYKPRRDHEKVVERNRDRNYQILETREDQLFWFRQRILHYGKNVRVLEPEWLADRLREELRQAYENYLQPLDSE
ncbi:WYL domain-containing protein [Lyngbya sp. CCY1209]|uniref:helix-turn-helix transcriptional regulator n=1 Tax=Lyngbya sp. CCY1209 TaxID=2886103 RepID=UPI002D1FDD02|nr:WYL domain-containing protein [Lyngbya sp. CCY1209]MEB3887061.1 WYL domain-containing protein [Lyngbya sp. CCY1209]